MPSASAFAFNLFSLLTLSSENLFSSASSKALNLSTLTLNSASASSVVFVFFSFVSGWAREKN
jgi:hypothetical protein